MSLRKILAVSVVALVGLGPLGNPFIQEGQAQIVSGPGLLRDASNATLPAARDNLGLGTANTPTFGGLAGLGTQPAGVTNPTSFSTNGSAIICSGAPWVDVECFFAAPYNAATDYTTAIAAAFAWVGTTTGNCAPLHFQRRVYKITSDIIVDIGLFAANCHSDGLKVLIEDGSDLDGSTITTTPTIEFRCTTQTFCNNLDVRGGRWTIKGANAGPIFVLGMADFSDKFLGGGIEILVPQNFSANVAAAGTQINNVVGMDIKQRLAFNSTAASTSYSMSLNQVSNSIITNLSPNWGNAGTAMYLTGTTANNTVILKGVADGNASGDTCVLIDAAGVAGNTFVAPSGSCNKAINATAGSANMMLNHQLVGTMTSLTGITRLTSPAGTSNLQVSAGAAPPILIGVDSGNTSFSGIGFDGGINDQNNAAIIGGGDNNLYLNVTTAKTHHIRVHGVDQVTVASTLMAVTPPLNAIGNIQNNGSLLVSATAPTIASGGCTTGSAQSVSASNGSSAFEITLGGATCGSTITLTMPAAAHNWVCDAHDITTPAGNVLDMTGAASTTAVVLTNFSRTLGTAANFGAADKLAIKCLPY